MATDPTPNEGHEGNDAPDAPTVSKEAVAELQATIDALQARVDKAEHKAGQQEGRAKKAEGLLKEKGGDAQAQLDELSQRLDLAQGEIEKRDALVATLTSAQKSAAVTQAVASVAARLADGASNDLIALMSQGVGIKDGRVVVLTENGTAKLSASTGREMTPSELCDEMLKARPYLQRSSSGGGSGDTGNTSGTTNVIDIDAFEKMSSAKREEAMLKMTPEQQAALFAKASGA